jgi:tellurite resistance protein
MIDSTTARSRFIERLQELLMARFRMVIPASLFGTILGLTGVGTAWRVAVRIWHAPAWVGELIMLAAAATWLTLLVLYASKWIVAPQAARAEIEHPVQAGFVSLIPLTTMLMALAIAPYGHAAAVGLWVVGVIGQLSYGAWFSGRVWQGGRDPLASTTVLYLPTVGVNFVAATVGGSLGYPAWGALFFGAGMLSWLALESLILQRHAVLAPLPLAQRATLGIQLAPPVVGAMAYLSVTQGPPDLFVQALFGYALLQALMLLRLLPWLRSQPVGVGLWAFTFGVTAIAVVPMRMIERGGTGPEQLLALPLFVFANLFVGALAIVTLRLALHGRLLPNGPVVEQSAPPA